MTDVKRKPAFQLEQWQIETDLNGAVRIWGKGYGNFFRTDGETTSDRIIQYYPKDHIVETVDYTYVLGEAA